MKPSSLYQLISSPIRIFLLVFTTVGVSSQLSAQITLDIDQANVVGLAKRNYYAINVWRGMDPSFTSHSDYQTQMEAMRPGFIRYHAAEQMKCAQGKPWIDEKSWIDCSKQKWDVDHIQSVLEQAVVSGNKIMINISTYPEWISSPNPESYAQFCADLVRIVNVDLGMKVKYWEPINEWNIKGYNGTEIADHYIACYQAMKAVDPDIQLCGPVSTHPQDSTITPFLKKLKDTGTPLDLFTYHQYQFGGSDDPSQASVYERSNNYISGIRAVRNELDAVGFEDVEIFVDEWNIFWVYDAVGREHMTSEVGACFDALALKYIIEGSEDLKLFGMAAWQDAGGTYGKIKEDFSDMNPGGHLLRLLNAHGVGEAVSCLSSRPAAVEGFAVKHRDGTAMIAVVNQALDGDRNVRLSANGWEPAGDLDSVTRHVINSYGLTTSTVSWKEITEETFRIGESDVVVFVVNPVAVSKTAYPDPDKWYYVENVGHTKYLQGTQKDDLSGSSCGRATQNVRGVGTHKTGSWTQWQFVDAGEGQYYVRSRGHDMHLQVSRASDATINDDNCGSGNPLTVRMADQSCRGDWVKWKLVKASSGTYRLYNAVTDTYLQALDSPDLVDGAEEGGVQLQQVAVGCNGSWTQWRLIEAGGSTSARQMNDSPRKLSAPTINLDFGVYPNPATIATTITIPASSAQQVNVEVFKPSGRTLMNQNYAVSNAKVQLSTESWREGLYLVRVTSQDAVYQTRLMIKH
jgi:xylan 1,4-beta-xylosidase